MNLNFTIFKLVNGETIINLKTFLNILKSYLLRGNKKNLHVGRHHFNKFDYKYLYSLKEMWNKLLNELLSCEIVNNFD